MVAEQQQQNNLTKTKLATNSSS